MTTVGHVLAWLGVALVVVLAVTYTAVRWRDR